MNEILWLTDDLPCPERIYHSLSTFLDTNIVSSALNGEDVLSQKLLSYSSVFVHINNPQQDYRILHLLSEYLETKRVEQKVIILLPIGYYDNQSDKDIQNFISSVIMYDNVILVTHSIIHDEAFFVEDYAENNEYPPNVYIQPITSLSLSTLLVKTLNKDFEHIIVHAIGAKTYSKSFRKKFLFFGQNSPLTYIEKQYTTSKKYESGIVEKIIQNQKVDSLSPKPQPTEA